jgi:uncharacterized protein YdeI (YjbR/CyaY-like superfamily)
MPNYIEGALRDRGVLEAYKARPAYQQNDYIGWITRAAQDETKQKRIEQMLRELEAGDVYMNMSWRPRRTKQGTASSEALESKRET